METCSSSNDLIYKNYLFVCDKVDNLGDLSCGFKVINDLHERIGVPLKNIFVVSNDVEGCQLFNKYHFKIENSKLNTVQKIIDESNIHLQITTSTDRGTAKHKLTGKVPVLALCEYDFNTEESTKDLVCKSLGLGKEAIGIMVDYSLKEWGFSHDAQDPIKRLQQLDEVSPILKKAILGKKEIQKFNETSCLYTSYARNFILLEYIKTIYQENIQKKNLVFVLSDISLKSVIELKLFNVGSIKLLKFNHETQEISAKKSVIGTGIKVKIVTGRIKHAEMLTIFKAAHPKVVVTGDQSLSEAISANLNFIYAAADHKHNLQNNLENLGYQTFEYESYRVRFPKFLTENKISIINQEICSKYDYLPNLTNVIKEIFASNFEITPSLEHLGIKKEFFDAIEMHKTTIVSLEQICQLEIQISTRKSKLPRFADSLFETSNLGAGRWIVKRMPLFS